MAEKRKRGRPRQTHCKRGHDLTDPANQKRISGGRRCRACQQAAERKSGRARRAKKRLLAEITPEMIAAGVSVFSLGWSVLDAEPAVECIFEAMLKRAHLKIGNRRVRGNA